MAPDARPPEGVETVRVYRCRECGALTTKDIHCYVKGPPLIPQMDDYSLCDPVDAVPLPVFLAEREAREQAERHLRDRIGQGFAEAGRAWKHAAEAEADRDAAVARAEQAEAERDKHWNVLLAYADALREISTYSERPGYLYADIDRIRGIARAALSPDPSGKAANR